MPAVIFDRKELAVDLNPFYSLDPGPVDRKDVKRDLKTLVDALAPGKLCLVTKSHVNGSLRSTTRYLFEVGEQGLLVKKNGDRTSLAIDVAREMNPASQVEEKVVLEGPSPYQFQKNPDDVNLTFGAVSTQLHWNEGTFSPAPGEFIPHRFGDFLGSFTVGQGRIKREHPQAVSELELRARSIPFVLPMQYYMDLGKFGSFGDVYDSAVQSMLTMLTETGHLERPLSYAEDTAIRGKAYSANSKSHRTRNRNLLRRNRNARKEWKKLLEDGKQRVRGTVIENLTLNAIKDVLGHLRYGKSKRGYWLCEVNQDFACDSEGNFLRDEDDKLIYLERRSLELIPSQIMHGVIYAIPKDELSGEFLKQKLTQFNEKYPDTFHTPQARQNYEIPEQTPVSTTQNKE